MKNNFNLLFLYKNISEITVNKMFIIAKVVCVYSKRVFEVINKLADFLSNLSTNFKNVSVVKVTKKNVNE